MKSLLPSNAGAFERAVSDVNASRIDVTRAAPALLRTLWNPWNCPEEELKYLAWAWSIDYWNDAWPVPRKRQVIAESRLYHRRKTTIAGVRMALGYRDADLVAWHLPRFGYFADRPVDPADETRWRAGLPEIRIYDPAPAVLDGPARRYADINCIAHGDARLARRAVLLRGGKETVLSILPVDGQERIVGTVTRRAVLVAGQAGSRTVMADSVGVPVLAVRPVDSGDSFVRPAATPGDAGTFVMARRRMIDGGRAVFTPVGSGGCRIVAPAAIAHGYLSLRYADTPGRAASRRPLNIVGRSRVMRAPFTAAWTVDWHRQVPRSGFPAGRRVFSSPVPVVDGIRDAIRAASALRDTGFLSLAATRRLTFADLRPVARGVTFGQRERILPYV